MIRLFTLFLSLSLLACEPEQADVVIDVQVKTGKGEPVDAADVLINDILAGTTDTSGRLNIQRKFPADSRQNIEIYKNSDKFYYARYKDSFQVASDKAQRLNIMATLYYAPKPTEADETELVDALDAKEIMEDPLVEAKADARARSQAEKKNSDVEPVPGANPVEPADEPEATVIAEKPEIEPSVEPKDPASSEIALSPVVETPSAKPKQAAKARPVKARQLTHTVHVYSGERPVPGAQVMFGGERSASLSEGCETNVRGRCVLKLTVKPGGLITLMVKKQGYQSKQKSIRIQAEGITRFNIAQGETIEIFAYQKRYNDISGLAEVQVYVEGKRVGSTDRFGHLSYVHPGQKSDLVRVTLKTDKALPEIFETDFVVSGPMTLARYYTPRTPPPVKMTLLRAQPSGSATAEQMKAFDGKLDRTLSGAVAKALFSLATYKKYPASSFVDAASRSGRSLGQMVKKGWATIDIKSEVDIAMVPTLVFKKRGGATLELAMIDSRGRGIAAAKESLEDLSDRAAVAQAVETIAEKLTRIYPFEGAVIGRQDSEVVINLGYSSGRGVAKGDELLVYGVQTDKLGRKQNFDKIATLQVTQVEDQSARAKIVNQKPRSLVQTGDLVVLHSRTHTARQRHQIRVVGKNKAAGTAPVEQANVYYNGAWLGSTDNDGRLYYDKGEFASKGLLKVIHYGYRDYAREVNLANRRVYEVRLVREMAFVRVDSKPQGATVVIDGEKIGKTPLHTPIPVPPGFVKLEVMAPQGYKQYSAVLELERGTLDLTGANLIDLEKDFRSLALKRIKAGEYRAAIKRLEEIPPTHSDYLRANHEIGELYLQKLNEPAKAAAAFAKVTDDKSVNQFTDKRFIGSHINEGIALYMTAEKLKTKEQATAAAHYLKAIEKLDSAAPQIRFVPKNQYGMAANNIGYYRALSYQRLWYQTKDKAYLNSAYKAWRDYMAQIEALPEKEKNKQLMASAEVYFKQAKATVTAKSEEQN